MRENQRRSRARRKELIDELTEKLREYESKEAQATIAMQAAARRVMWENGRLRELLAHKGISPDEISAYLKGYDVKRLTVAAAPPAPEILATKEEPADEIEGDAEAANSMSCENAASIIAGMRGHNEDEDVVRLRLGCGSNQTCKVKNVQVFQVMEMD